MEPCHMIILQTISIVGSFVYYMLYILRNQLEAAEK